MTEITAGMMVKGIEEAIELISEPENWTEGAMARDEDGDEVRPNSYCATCWCAAGALRRALEVGDLDYGYDEVMGIEESRLTDMNDTVGRERAIEELKALRLKFQLEEQRG